MSKMCEKQVEAKRDDEINQQNNNLDNFKHGKLWCSQNATNQPTP